MNAGREMSPRSFDDYPRPSVAVDTAVLTVDSGRLCVVLVHGGRGLALPGTFLHPGERLSDAVHRSLHEKAGIEGLLPTQLHVFDDPERDDRGWVLSVAHVDVVPTASLAEAGAKTETVPVDALPQLPWDHEEIVVRAVELLRHEHRSRPDPRRLLSSSFTLRELRRLHEAIAGHPLPSDTFRRLMQPMLVATGEATAGTVGKPARLFTHQEHR